MLTAMPRMLIHLAKNPEVGLLSYEQWFGGTTMLLSSGVRRRTSSALRPTRTRRIWGRGGTS